MEERLLNIYKGIMEDDDLGQVEAYFNNRCYLTIKDFGLLLSHFLTNSTSETKPILDIIFKSKKFKDMNACCDKFGEPIVNCLIYDMATAKPSKKAMLRSIIMDEDIPLKWNVHSESLDSPLHVIASTCEDLGLDITWDLLALAMKNNCNPLDKNDANMTAMQIFRYDVINTDMISEDMRNEFIKFIEKGINKQMIKIKADAYDVLETTETVLTPTIAL